MSTTFGILCLLPPIVAIVLALITKQTILSLFVATWLGSTMINGWNPIVGFVKIISDYMVPAIASEWNASLLVLVTFSGGLIAMLRVIGAAQAFAALVTRSINNAKKGQIVTCLSAFIFSYTEPCLILGTIMRPVTDAVRVSRAKLAYILDSMGCNLASFSPISSYGPFIAGLIATQLAEAGIKGNEWAIWAQMLPFNMYSLFAMITVIIVAVFGLNIGPMYAEEKRARETGKLLADGVDPLVPEMKNVLPEGYKLSVWNFIIPMTSLFLALFATIFWTGNFAENGLKGAFLNGNITLAICMGFLAGGIGAGVMGVTTKLFTPAKAFNHFVDGMAELISVPFILICAWSMGKITGTMEVGNYMAGVVQNHLAAGLVPAMVFIFGSAISFATGSSWGVWSIMMPIAFPMAVAFNLPIPYVVGAVISGGMFGDQCSPISDTTILSSTGASCNHVVHVMTQLPYGLAVGVSAFIGFLVGGLTGQYMLSIAVTAIVLYAALFILTKVSKHKNIESTELAHL
ncbi:Na+/H+ antiporter NhaC family protein [Geosporobacter ferrireducens]|uniref:Sodium:proton antiporter n=1 Tax=Geosporobacter ferrireducens TaxID=1424294 RepID=A0A1D8GIN2_9FIRM|nr:Na+/H+ antiporter NhaC family protein [Geosporobacter ferrireducens]AOT70757.1 sodium:proton antiporter [Geosporobacter ferrireducens]